MAKKVTFVVSDLVHDTQDVYYTTGDMTRAVKDMTARLRAEGYRLKGSARENGYSARRGRGGHWIAAIKIERKTGRVPQAVVKAQPIPAPVEAKSAKPEPKSKAAPPKPNGPTLADDNIPPEFQSECWTVTNGVALHVDRFLAYGPPGTGKTTLAHTLAAHLKTRCYSVPMTPETPAAELRGHFIPRGGEFKWMDGPAITAWKEGAVLCIDEIDQASGDALIFLHSILDDKSVAKITLPNGETVVPHNGFRVVATMNGQPEDLPEALLDRFAVRMEIAEPNPQAILRLPEDLRSAAHGTVALEDVARRVTMRTWLAFAGLRDKVGQDFAARVVFKHRADEIIDSLKIAAAASDDE